MLNVDLTSSYHDLPLFSPTNRAATFHKAFFICLYHVSFLFVGFNSMNIVVMPVALLQLLMNTPPPHSFSSYLIEAFKINPPVHSLPDFTSVIIFSDNFFYTHSYSSESNLTIIKRPNVLLCPQ